MRRLLRSTKHALKGIVFTLRSERNFQVEMGVAFLVLLLMVSLPLSRAEDLILILTIVLVLAAELINTAVERVMDILKPRVHPYAKVVKDVTAGAVLLVSLGALLVGGIIFWPYFFH